MFRRHVLARSRLFVRYVRKFVLHNILHADDPPERLALGVAIGVGITFTPTIGLQSLIVIFLAWLFRANKIVGLPILWISNPATVVPIFYPCYVIGAMILGHEIIGLQWWNDLRSPPEGWWATVDFYWGKLAEVAAPLWVGCMIVATVLGLLSYYVMFHFIRSYRLRKWGKLVPPTYISPEDDVKENAA